MFEKIGFLIMCIGAMMGNNESLLVPAGVIALGVGMVFFGVIRGGNDETV